MNYEMNRNLMLYEREVYTSLDWFGNLGGLSEGLKLIFGLIIGFFNYNYYNNYMVAKLFTYKNAPGFRSEDSELPEKMTKKKTKSFSSALSTTDAKLDPKGLNPCVLLFHACVPRRCEHLLESKSLFCCRKSPKYAVFEQGNELYEHEIDIVRLLQHFRFMRHFAKNMVDTMPVSDRFKFNNVIKKSMMKQVTLNSKSIEGESETSNSENSENSYLNSIYSPTKNVALGNTGNLNNSGGSSDR